MSHAPSVWLLGALLCAGMPARAQSRPDEAELFGDATPAQSTDDGGTGLPAAASEPTAPASTAAGPSQGDVRDETQLGGPAAHSRFDTEEEKSDALKIGGTLNLFGQGFWQEGRPFEQGTLSAPFLLDVYLDGRPTDRLRAFAQARLQYDPTRPQGDAAADATAPTTSSASLVGLTPSTSTNPSVALDQLWLRFDIARAVYFTIGRQKVRWGTARIWYPTDFLNSRPRDALNPFDVRLGVNMLKVHVPVESLGWNLYAYGLLDAVKVSSSGVSLEQLGGALRAEFVLGPAELGLGGVWQKGRRPRYGVDLSTALGPVDAYAEVAFRDARDFVLFRYPSDLSLESLTSVLLTSGERLEAYRPAGIMVQASAGLSWQFNYTDKNLGILGVEYFYNPAGYEDIRGYQVKTFFPALAGVTLDPSQNTPLYSGKHNLAATLTAPGLPGFDWITLTLSSIVIVNDPAGLTRLDAIFRVLSSLWVQAFASVFYGQTGGQLRFNLSTEAINELAKVSELFDPGSGDQVREGLAPLRWAPVVQAGVVLRLAI